LGVAVITALTVAAPATALADAPIARPAPVGSAFSFGLWGDMPYAKGGDYPKMTRLVNDINSENIAFSVYDGDVKDGSSLCTPDQYAGATELFNSIKVPTVYVPGDNEWTDCHRINNGGFNNIERLNYIRRTMFNTPNSFGKVQMVLEHQGPSAVGMPPSDGYTNFLNILVDETLYFSGQVLFVHGDTHFFKMDKPLMSNGADRDVREATGTILQNFTRVMTFGSPSVHWLKVEVDPSSRALFKVSPMMVPGN
ncbi:MAG: hypothetical protein EBT47_08670, partial [Chloroflexi bacterium]|nr:hypothetical protein [Chloroflexota bacterium]